MTDNQINTQDDIRSVIVRLVNTADGVKVLRYLHDICGFNAYGIVMNNDGEIALLATAYNEIRRGVYLNLRQYIPWDRLAEIEHRPNKVEEKPNATRRSPIERFDDSNDDADTASSD